MRRGDREQLKPLNEPLTAENLEERFVRSFPNNYLASVSIIQGVALGILANQTLGGFRPKAVADLAPLGYAALTLLFLCLVSYEYSWFIALFRWPPEPLDIAVPLLLGVLEVTPAFFIRPASPALWWGTTGLFLVGGLLAFVNNRFRVSDEMFENPSATALVVRNISRNVALTGAMATVALAAAWMVTMRAAWFQWPAALLIVVAALFMTLKDHHFLRALRRLYGFR